MDPRNNLTVGGCIAGLLAFGNKAIIFQLFVTRWGYPILEVVPGFSRDEVIERLFGSQDVPRTALDIRDELVSITASLLLMQKQIAYASSEVSIDVEGLMAALIGCVRTYAEFERLHSISNQKSEPYLPSAAKRGLLRGSPMENILTRLSEYSAFFHSTVLQMTSKSLQEILPTQLAPSGSGAEPGQVTPSLSPLSQMTVPIKLLEISNNHWYISDIENRGALSHEDEAARKSPFNTIVATNGLPPSNLLGVPSRRNAPQRGWPSDPKLQAKAHSWVEEELKIRDEKRRNEREIVLMGDYESASPVLKDMRKAHLIERLERSTENLKYEVFNYLLRHLELVVREIDKAYWEKSHYIKPNIWAILVCLQEELQPGDEFPPRLLPAFQILWEDSEVKTALKKRSELLFQDFEYFFQNISRIFQHDYAPTLNDLQQLDPIFPTRIGRNRTSNVSIESTTYNLLYIRLGEGALKWKRMQHLVEDVAAILVLVDLNNYDALLIEDRPETSIHDSLQFFEQIARLPRLQNCELVLLFTNIDAFRKKVESGNAPIKKFFPSFDDFYEDGETGLQFFTRLFRAEHKSEGRILSVEYTYPDDPNTLQKLHQCINCSVDARSERRKEHSQ